MQLGGGVVDRSFQTKLLVGSVGPVHILDTTIYSYNILSFCRLLLRMLNKCFFFSKMQSCRTGEV